MIPNEVKELIDLKIKKAIDEIKAEYDKEISALKDKIKANKIEIDILKEGGNI